MRGGAARSRSEPTTRLLHRRQRPLRPRERPGAQVHTRRLRGDRNLVTERTPSRRDAQIPDSHSGRQRSPRARDRCGAPARQALAVSGGGLLVSEVPREIGRAPVMNDDLLARPEVRFSCDRGSAMIPPSDGDHRLVYADHVHAHRASERAIHQPWRACQCRACVIRSSPQPARGLPAKGAPRRASSAPVEIAWGTVNSVDLGPASASGGGWLSR